MTSQLLDTYLAELHEWVSIESPSSNHETISKLGERVIRLCEASGLSVERAGGANGACPTLLARGGQQTGEPGLLVLAHLDTVHPVGTLATKLPWKLDGDRLYGPGIYDMKGSALMALMAWSQLQETGRAPKVPVTFLFAPDEEVGSPSSREVIEAEGRKALASLVVEPARDGGKIVIARKGVARFEITATGRAAHSGTNFDLGRNAISEIAAQISKLDALTNIAEGITINVGTIRGGTSSNTVAEICTIEVDVRLQTLDQVESVLSAIRSLRPLDPDVTLEITGELNRPPFDHHPASQAFFMHARSVAAGVGIDLVGVSAGGASDGNFTSALGVPTLDGLGVDGAGAHTLDEHILVSSVLPRIHFFAAMLASTGSDVFRR